MLRLANAIGKREGFPEPGTVPHRLNNPGDLLYASQPNAVAVRVTGPDGRVRVFAKFDTPQHGWAALLRQLAKLAQMDYTVEKAIKRWAPKEDGNDTASYLAFVCAKTGYPKGKQLYDLCVPGVKDE